MKNLEQTLLNAKKFMEHDAMNKNREGIRINRNIQTESINIPTQLNQSTNMSVPTSRTPNMNPKSNMSKESIMNSKLPDAIKKAMIETPIPDVSPTPTLSESFIDQVSKKMNSEEYSIENMRSTSNSNLRETTQRKVNVPTSNNYDDPIPPLFQEPQVDTNSLKETIKECIRELMNEENLLIESKNINENLQIRVGNKIFSGNIKSIKSVKK